ncbi:MAG: choice-of-anchor Q domain-containing protein [Verrucomicrobiae bacterium]|nr:choice-of-anchor Q domain-containing protein [Verrucomicrobiae bacterium]
MNFKSLALAFLALTASMAGAQDINVTVAPNIGGDNFVDIVCTNTRWYFYSAPTPSAAVMAREDSLEISQFSWPSPGFGPDVGNYVNDRMFPGEYLRVYPKTLPVGTTITIPYAIDLPLNPQHNINVTVLGGPQVTGITCLDANPTALSTVHWQVTFDQAISGVTAANFAFKDVAGISPVAITSVTADTAQPATSWTVTASVGNGLGLLGLDWKGHQTESPGVYNSYVGYVYSYTSYPIVTLDPVSAIVSRNASHTLTANGIERGTNVYFQWFSGSSQFPNSAAPIPNATSASYTATYPNLGSFSYFCRVYATRAYYSDSLTATITVTDPPVITNQPAGTASYIGLSASLSVGVSGAGLQYQWYQGAAPDTSTPVGGNSATLATPPLTATTQFWVRVTDGVGSVVNSTTATVTALAASLFVTTLQDVSGVPGVNSLRDAIAYGTHVGGPLPVTFDPALFSNGPVVLKVSSFSAINITGLGGKLTISGPGPKLLTICGNQSQIFQGDNSATLEIDNLTLSNGFAGVQGGAVYGGSLAFSNVVFTHNYSTGGGAVCAGKDLSIYNCTFSNNISSSSGGAVYCDSSLLMAGSTFVNNQSGINNLGSTNGVFSGAMGGAVYVNVPVFGISIANCTFAGNYAHSGSGGGAVGIDGNFIYSDSPAVIANCTFTGNTADGSGGGLKMAALNRPLALNNCIVSGNSAATNANLDSPSLGVTNSLIDVDPVTIFKTGQLADNGGLTWTVALKPGGAAINAGNNTILPAGTTTDQRGSPRILLGTVDIGAYEATPTELGMPSVVAGGAYWYLGTNILGSDLDIHREVPGQAPVTVDGAASWIGLQNDGSVVVENSSRGTYTRIGSVNGAGTGWQQLNTVIGADNAAWFIGTDGPWGSQDSYIYRWAIGGAPAFSDGWSKQLSVWSDGLVVATVNNGALYRRIGSNAGLGTEWDLLTAVNAPVHLNAPKKLGGGKARFSFTGQPNGLFSMLTSTNLADWTAASGTIVENPAGQYQFTNTVDVNTPQRFYRVSSP